MADISIPNKICNRCNLPQPLTSFGAHKAARDGRYPTCRSCMSLQSRRPFILREKDIVRFWSKVDKTPGHGPNGECWLWTRGVDRDGYGQFDAQKVPLRAHRVSYLIEHGKLTDGLQVCHTCDTPQCVRPTHLFEGTADENNKDKARKGRATGRGYSPRTTLFCQVCATPFEVIPSRSGKAKYCSQQCQLTVVHGPASRLRATQTRYS